MSHDNLPPLPEPKGVYADLDDFGNVVTRRDGNYTADQVRQAMRDAVAASAIGAEVSMDVSTGDADAEHRIFGRIEEVMTGAGGEVVLLAVEESRNFAVAASGAGVPDAVREAVEAAFEGREGWMRKMGAAVRALAAAPTPDRATVVAPAEAVTVRIDLEHGAYLIPETKTTGAPGWLMYNEFGLVRALNSFETLLAESFLAKSKGGAM